jgi:hypothetical protein
MSTKSIIGVSLPRETITKIDEARGDISRSRFLWRIVEKALVESAHSGRKLEAVK